MYGRKFDCDSVEGRLICDEIAPVDRMDDALAAIVEGLIANLELHWNAQSR